MLTPEQRAAYDRDGYVILRRLVPPDACARMADRLWQALGEVHGIRRDDPATWTRAMPRRLQEVRVADAFAEMASPALRAAIDDLIGAGTWDPPAHWGDPLPNFPVPGPWRLPARMWHLDYPVRGRWPAPFAVKALCLLAPVATRGGATLLLEGSQHLAARLGETAPPGDAGHSGDVRARLAREDAWLRDLFSKHDASDRVERFLVEGREVHGVRLRVVEFTGDAGDVVLFHPWLFHNVSPNCRDVPRLMTGQNLTTRAGLAIYAPSGADVDRPA